MSTSNGLAWSVSGTYFEACNCLPICPCRQIGGRDGGRSTFGVCDFALSWLVTRGHIGTLDLTRRQVVLVGTYDDDEPGSPWTVSLFVDDRADGAQHAALADIFLGRAGGSPLRNYGGAIRTVVEVRPARMELDHRRRHWRIRVEGLVDVDADDEVESTESVACGIPGFDHAGQEVQSKELRVHSTPLVWDWAERWGCATDSSDR